MFERDDDVLDAAPIDGHAAEVEELQRLAGGGYPDELECGLFESSVGCAAEIGRDCGIMRACGGLV